MLWRSVPNSDELVGARNSWQLLVNCELDAGQLRAGTVRMRHDGCRDPAFPVIDNPHFIELPQRLNIGRPAGFELETHVLIVQRSLILVEAHQLSRNACAIWSLSGLSK